MVRTRLNSIVGDMKKNEEQPLLIGCLTWVMAGLAVLLSVFSLMCRSDSHEEVRTVIILDGIVIGPLWATVVFLYSRSGTRAKPRAFVLAALAWVLSASLLATWEVTKMDMRLRARQLHEQKMRSPEQTD